MVGLGQRSHHRAIPAIQESARFSLFICSVPSSRHKTIVSDVMCVYVANPHVSYGHLLHLVLGAGIYSKEKPTATNPRKRVLFHAMTKKNQVRLLSLYRPLLSTISHFL